MYVTILFHLNNRKTAKRKNKICIHVLFTLTKWKGSVMSALDEGKKKSTALHSPICMSQIKCQHLTSMNTQNLDVFILVRFQNIHKSLRRILPSALTLILRHSGTKYKQNDFQSSTLWCIPVLEVSWYISMKFCYKQQCDRYSWGKCKQS